MFGARHLSWKFFFLLGIAAFLVPAARLTAQFNDTQGFDGGTPGTPFAIPAGSIPYWTVDGACSPATVFKDGIRGDNGSNCILTMMPVGTGTRMIRDLNPGPGSSTFGGKAVVTLDVLSRLLVSADDGLGTSGQEFYRVLNGLYPVLTLEKDINPGAGSSGPAGLYQQYPGGLGKVYFSADDGTNGREPWLCNMSTGLTITTTMVSDINLGGSSNPSGFAAAAAVSTTLVVFAADDGTNGRELWKTDGTAIGTTMLMDINTSSAGASSDPQLQTSLIISTAAGALDTRVFFTADNGVNGRELWRTNGTLAGTGLVKDFAGAAGSNPANLTAASPLVAGVPTPTLFFTVDSDGVNGQELWKSRGALDGSDTVQVYDPGAAGSPANLTNLGGLNLLFFTLGNDLWKSNGTTAGTVLVKTFAAPSANLVSAGSGLTNVLYFTADDGTGSGVELWKADATGASLAKDINPGANSSSPQNLFAIGGAVYFSADDGSNGRELWRSDATAGALLIKDINPGPIGSDPSGMAGLDGTLVFAADDGTHGRELWQSDGFDAPSKNGMSYKWDLASLIQSKGDPGKVAVAGSNAKPLYTYWLHDFPAMGGSTGVSEVAHQINVYLELTDGIDRVPLNITNVDCGDGNLPRPKAALTDGSNHNAIAFGMVAVLDQNPCDTDTRGGGNPAMPFAYVPAIYDGHDWIPMRLATVDYPSGIPAGVPTAPPSGTVMGQTSSFAYLRTGLPSNLVAATDDPWSTKRFAFARLDVSSDYITVMWGKKQDPSIIWVATVPRQYKRAFKTLYFGNKGCVQSAYPVYLDSVTLNTGIFVSSAEPVGACCLSDGCVDGVISDTACAALGGMWAGFDTTCDGGVCVGACCQKMAICTETLSNACNGDFVGLATNCATATCPCHTPVADADWDGDVDQTDFAAFQGCFTGPGSVALPAGCKCFDRSPVPFPSTGYDGDIDVDDYDAFEKCASGSGIAMNPGC